MKLDSSLATSLLFRGCQGRLEEETLLANLVFGKLNMAIKNTSHYHHVLIAAAKAPVSILASCSAFKSCSGSASCILGKGYTDKALITSSVKNQDQKKKKPKNEKEKTREKIK